MAMYRAELSAKRQGKNETYQALQQDISRLMFLAYDDPLSKSSMSFAVDAYIKSFSDRDVAEKVQDVNPKDLDDALRHALRFDANAKARAAEGRDNAGRYRRDDLHAKVVTYENTGPPVQTSAEGASTKMEADLQKLLRKMELLEVNLTSCSAHERKNQVTGGAVQPATTNPTIMQPSVNPPMWYPVPQMPPQMPSQMPFPFPYAPTAVPNQAPPPPVENGRPRPNNPRVDKKTLKCYNCGELGHFSRECPQRSQANMMRVQRSLIPWTAEGQDIEWDDECIKAHKPTYLRMKLFGREHLCLLDSGCNQTVVPPEVAAGLPMRGIADMNMTAANGSRMEVFGEVEVPFELQGLSLPAASLVSPEVDEVLIGADWMGRHGMKWDFSTNEVRFKEIGVTLEGAEARYFCRKIVSEIDVCVPPSREMMVPARYVLPDDHPVLTKRWFTEERTSQLGLMVKGSELPDRLCGLPIWVKNETEYAVRVERGTRIASAVPYGYEVDEMPMRSPHVDFVNDFEGDADSYDANEWGHAQPERDLAEVEWMHARVVKSVGIETGGPFSHVDPLAEGADGLESEEQKDQLKKVLRDYADTFSAGAFDLGKTGLAKHSIDTGSAKPVKQVLRQQPRSQLQAIDDQTREMEEAGLIEPSHSPWVSNVVIVTKKDGSPRFCIDYRKLNELTVKDAYPLPKIETCLDALGGAKFFSTFDLRSGYHQVLMEPRDADKTSFVTRTGTYRFKVMPFGLCNAGATFQRVMDIAMKGLNFKICLVYLDDIIVYSQTFEQHMENLTAVLQRLREAGLKLKPSKCKLYRKSVDFLGHVVSDQGIATDPEKVKDIVEWPTPSNATEVRSFLGLASYYRRFVPDFAQIAAPLHKLTGKEIQFNWNDGCAAAMKTLQGKLASSPVLAMPADEGEYTLDTDASDGAIGAVLSQTQDGEERVIAYTSRTLRGPELNYCVTRKELLAVVFFAKRFRQYLLGRKFKIRTDHAALQWLQKTPTPIGQQARWLDILGNFHFEVIHRPGKSHQNADALSRKPCRQCGVDEDRSKDMESTSRLCAIRLGDVDAIPESPWAVEVMAAETVNDPDLKMVVGWLSDAATVPAWSEVSGLSKEVRVFYKMLDRLRLHRGIVYRRWYEKDGKPSHWQIVVPEKRRLEFVRLAHEGSTGGHLGEKKTYEQVQRRAYWPGLNQDIGFVLKRCAECVAYHRGKLPRKGMLQPMTVGETWERLSLDVTGPHPKSRSGKKFIVTMVDHHTKWAEAFAVSNHEAVTIARILTGSVFPRFGVPRQILTDRGTEFEGKLMSALCRALDIDKLRTTAYKPSTNGVVERFHRTLNSMLGKVVSVNQRDWDEHLPTVMAAYRATQHDATGYSPNYLMLGREARAPLDLVFDLPMSQEDQHDSYDEFVSNYQKRSRAAHRLVREHLKRAAERNKDHYDVRVRPSPFRVGDWVYYYNPRRYQGRSPKWQRMFSGPFLVVEVKGQVNVLIQASRRARPFIVHVDKLKHWIGKHPLSWIEAGSGDVGIADVDPRGPVDVRSADEELALVGGPIPGEADGEDKEDSRSDESTERMGSGTPGPSGRELDGSAEEMGGAKRGDVVEEDVEGEPMANVESGRPRRTVKKPARYVDRVVVNRCRLL